MAIDNPLDDPEQHAFPSSGNPTADMLLEAASGIVPPLGLFTAIKAHYSRREASERLRTFLVYLKKEALDHQGLTWDEFQDKISDPECFPVLLDAVDAVIRSADHKRIKRLAAVLGGTLCMQSPDWDEAAGLIADLIRLTERDLRVLSVMSEVFPSVPTGVNQSAVSGCFTSKLENLITAYRDAGLGWDEFYSHAARLTGFGLAIEVHQVNRSKTIEEDINYCFRPTGRGKRLVDLLSGVRQNTSEAPSLP